MSDEPIQQVRTAPVAKPRNYERDEMIEAVRLALMLDLPSEYKIASVHEMTDGAVEASVRYFIDKATYEAFLASDAYREWSETTVAGLRELLRKERETVRKLKAKAKAPETASESEEQTEAA